MTTVHDIQAAILALSPPEIELVREWVDAYLEDHSLLSDDVKAKLEQSKSEIAAGEYSTRHTDPRASTKGAL